ncbi:disulfide bond formation protein B [Bacillus sp. HMF5848]|uniref:disulfide oxidoreductase n=1 Tax=Bacillus sp. HMF5848 TaxID=2495421 RepID=UPI000F7A7CB0|nr:disulfide oxidoreductase [Bacillus sp. HMF5848]RSK26225.1 disulfide bond formation protein B [Bacillus sp. HMF5848]
MRNNILSKDNALFVSWAASLVATIGSLFFSEVQKYIPCELCWYQRIFMYPLVILLGIAIIKKDYLFARYSIAMSSIGGLISFYHILIQKVPAFQSASPSCTIIPCTTTYINWFGFISIPVLAFIAFTTIFIMSIFILKK